MVQAKGNIEPIKNQIGQANNNHSSNPSNIHIVNAMALSEQPPTYKATVKSMNAFVLKNNEVQR